MISLPVKDLVWFKPCLNKVSWEQITQWLRWLFHWFKQDFGPMRFDYGWGYSVETEMQPWLWRVPIKTFERHKVSLSELHCPGLLKTLCYPAAPAGYRKPSCFCFDCFLSRALWSWLKLMTFTACFSCILNNCSWPRQQALINLHYPLYRKPFTRQHYIATYSSL